ncbi:MAG: NAD(P)H-dependent glycerol-3-phosphate dehydrogenase [Candidatus Hodarchaeota archaeon]
MATFIVLGAGAMGTAMSHILASNGYDVLMWARRKEVANNINQKKINIEYMPNLILPPKVKATSNLEKCLEGSNRIVCAIPSHSVNELCLKLSKYDLSKKLWLSVIKGMDLNCRCTISQYLQHQLPIKEDEITVLSGPNFAIEIVENTPTIGVLGSKSRSAASVFCEALTTEHFLIESTDDLIGVEIGGVLKNIGAIAIGSIDGLNLGDNTRGLIFSRYMQEVWEVGIKVFRVKEETLLGPACLGDMITTAFSYKSRNRIIGLLASKCIANIPKHTFIAEGKNNTQMIKELAHEYRINVPVTEFVDSVLTSMKPYIAFNNLWKKLKEEITEKNRND